MTENEQQFLNPIQKIIAALREVIASPADADAAERGRAALAELDAIGTAYLTVQEGGSSSELYISSAESEDAAHDFRVSCARASYRTSDAIEVPAYLNALGEDLYTVLEQVAHATNELDYVDADDEDEDEDEDEKDDATAHAQS